MRYVRRAASPCVFRATSGLTVAERAGSPERAISLFRHIIETVPGFVPAYEALGRLLRDPDDLPQVFTVIQALSGSSPTRLLRRLGRPVSA